MDFLKALLGQLTGRDLSDRMNRASSMTDVERVRMTKARMGFSRHGAPSCQNCKYGQPLEGTLLKARYYCRAGQFETEAFAFCRNGFEDK